MKTIPTNPKRKLTVAVIHPGLFPGGGSESCSLFVAQALKDDYDVTIITMGNTDLPELNRWYGTTLTTENISLISLPLPRFFQYKFDALRNKLPRFCKKVAPQFDIMISTYNVMDFGKRGMQIIADFSFDENLRKLYNWDDNFRKFIYQDTLLRKVYLWFARWVSGISEKNWRNNFTVSLSQWEALVMKENFGMDSFMVYPPVIAEFKDVPLSKRKNGVVIIGRLSPEKEIHKVIEIVKRARQADATLTLHIVGKIYERYAEYAQLVMELCQENKEWCFYEGQIFGQKKLDFISSYKYGIHGRSSEPFGIAVAELAKGGCVTFVPNGGGQTEIVGRKELIYDNIDDAVAKIEAVLKNPALQEELQRETLANARQFSATRYMEGIRLAVSKFIQEEKLV
jgi:glycosyltransferase involved in cell wall biosynthesis